MDPQAVPPTDGQYVKVAIATIIAGLLGLIGLGIKKGTPVLVNRVVKVAVHEEFSAELERIDRTAESVARVEATQERMAADMERMATDVCEIRDILREFAQQIGQLQGRPADA